MKISARARWRLAHLLDKLPGQCWTNLVSWALDGPAACRRRGESPLPWRPVTDTCRQTTPPNDRCYCGKVGARTTPTDVPAVVTLRASDAADQLTARIGDDDQFRRWRTIPVHIRRNANAENAAIPPDPN